MKIGIGNDHAAVAMKNEIKAYLEELGHEVVDFGTQVCNDRTYTKCTERSTDGRIGGQVIEYARY